MLTKTEYVDKYGNKVIDYRLTKGDSFSQDLKVVNLPTESDVIEKILFKLGDYDYNWLMEKQYEYVNELDKYIVELTSDETESLTEDETYRYQIKIFYVGGLEETAMSGKFTITNFIPEEV